MLNWGSFAKEKSGEWDGLNNAAIYSFNSNVINSFVREMFQNSIDARDKELPRDQETGKLPPLHIKINYKRIKREEFPDFEGLREIFKKISASKPNQKHQKFLKNAFDSLTKKKEISLFVYEDYNTTGLHGKDDDPSGTFNACVVSEGISIKTEATSGGSFGIGKNAIYGLSKLRTVFYSSFNPDGKFIFQGKAKLASYYDEYNQTRDNKIYCGLGEKRRSVRSISEMPDPYKSLFYRDEPGLSQYAMFPVENEEWPSEFLKAILRNYWMLLEKNELIVELLRQDKVIHRVDRTNLEELLKKCFDPNTYTPEDVKPAGNPYEFYRCFKEGICLSRDQFPYLKKVRFYYRELEDKNTNAVAYLRNDMVVYSQSIHGFGSVNYCGVFICDEDEGNTILKAMEPPTHDEFSAELLAEQHEKYEVKDGKALLKDIRFLIRQGLQEIKDKYTKPAEDIPWLNDLVSSLTGSLKNGRGKRKNERAEEETSEKIGKDILKTLSFHSSERNTVVNDKTGEIESLGGGNPRKRQPKPGPKPGPLPGPGPGPVNGKQKINKTKIKSRIFKTPNRKLIDGKIHNSYKIILESQKEITADIILSQQGDTGNTAVFEIGEAKAMDGSIIKFSEEYNNRKEVVGYRLKDVNIPSSLQLYVNEPYKSSFKLINS